MNYEFTKWTFTQIQLASMEIFIMKLLTSKF